MKEKNRKVKEQREREERERGWREGKGRKEGRKGMEIHFYINFPLRKTP